MINSRFSRDTKLSASSRNEIIKREFERFKKMIKSKTLVSSRSSRRDSENVETKSKSHRFVVDLMSLIISASSARVDREFNIRRNESRCLDSSSDDVNFFSRWSRECVCRKFDLDSDCNFCDWLCCHVRVWVDYRDWLWESELRTR